MIKVQHPNAQKLPNLINWHYEPWVHSGRTGLKLHHVSHIVSVVFNIVTIARAFAMVLLKIRPILLIGYFIIHQNCNIIKSYINITVMSAFFIRLGLSLGRMKSSTLNGQVTRGLR